MQNLVQIHHVDTHSSEPRDADVITGQKEKMADTQENNTWLQERRKWRKGNTSGEVQEWNKKTEGRMKERREDSVREGCEFGSPAWRMESREDDILILTFRFGLYPHFNDKKIANRIFFSLFLVKFHACHVVKQRVDPHRMHVTAVMVSSSITQTQERLLQVLQAKTEETVEQNPPTPAL